MKTTTRNILIITGGLFVLTVIIFGLFTQNIIDGYFYYTRGQNGGHLDSVFGGTNQVKNYQGAFRDIRSENSYLVFPTNFLSKQGGSDNCFQDVIITEAAQQRVNSTSERIDIAFDTSDALKIEVKGFIDGCIQDNEQVDYATSINASTSITQNFKHSITDFNDLKVKQRLDCMSYELDGQKYIRIGLRLENGTPNNYTQEFTSSCTLEGLSSGEYQVEYIDSDIEGVIVTI